MATFLINIFLTIYAMTIWIFSTMFIFLIVNDEEAIKRAFAKFIIKICKIWNTDTSSLFYTINQLKQKKDKTHGNKNIQ